MFTVPAVFLARSKHKSAQPTQCGWRRGITLHCNIPHHHHASFHDEFSGDFCADTPVELKDDEGILSGHCTAAPTADPICGAGGVYVNGTTKYVRCFAWPCGPLGMAVLFRAHVGCENSRLAAGTL